VTTPMTCPDIPGLRWYTVEDDNEALMTTTIVDDDDDDDEDETTRLTLIISVMASRAATRHQHRVASVAST
jgi:hypothetical protein